MSFKELLKDLQENVDRTKMSKMLDRQWNDIEGKVDAIFRVMQKQDKKLADSFLKKYNDLEEYYKTFIYKMNDGEI